MRVKMQRKRKQILLLFIDVVILYASLYLSLIVRNGELPNLAKLADHIELFSFSFVAWILIFYTAGLYNLNAILDNFSLVRRTAAAVAFSTLVTALMFYLVKEPAITPKTVLALFALLAAALLYLWRSIYARIILVPTSRRGVAFVGLNMPVADLAQADSVLAQLGYRARLVLHDERRAAADAGRGGSDCDGAPAVQGLTGSLPEGILVTKDRGDLERAIRSGEVELVVIGDDEGLDPDTRRLLFGLLSFEARCMSLPDFYELAFRKVPLGRIDEDWFLENIDLRSHRPYLTLKRAADIVLSSILFIVSLPFWPFIAIAIKLESPGPVFFTQERLGRGGKPFRMVKFRTMRTDRNDFRPTAVGDPRVTRIGSFMRKSRIDEIPQILNILAGDMSFIGPRPERPDLAEKLAQELPYYAERLLVKPGITGWDQVSGEYHSPSVADTYKKLQYDLYYVKNLGLILDVSVLFKTVFTALSRSGR